MDFTQKMALYISAFALLDFLFVKMICGKKMGLFMKIVASLGFLLVGAVAIFTNNLGCYKWFFIAGLVLGLIGDIFMDLKEQGLKHEHLYFNLGMLSFGIGHAMYLVGLTIYSNSTFPWWASGLISVAVAIALTFAIFAMSGKVGIVWGNCKNQSFVYSVVLSTMVVYSIINAFFAAKVWLMMIGMIFFIVSDLLLSMIYFAKKETKVMHTLNWVTYYIAQNLIAVFLMII